MWGAGEVLERMEDVDGAGEGEDEGLREDGLVEKRFIARTALAEISCTVVLLHRFCFLVLIVPPFCLCILALLILVVERRQRRLTIQPPKLKLQTINPLAPLSIHARSTLYNPLYTYPSLGEYTLSPPCTP